MPGRFDFADGSVTVRINDLRLACFVCQWQMSSRSASLLANQRSSLSLSLGVVLPRLLSVFFEVARLPGPSVYSPQTQTRKNNEAIPSIYFDFALRCRRLARPGTFGIAPVQSCFYGPYRLSAMDSSAPFWRSMYITLWCR
jgi:hypothetical protein